VKKPAFPAGAASLALLFAFLPAARAQLPSAELHGIDPPAAAAGETLVVSLSGANLEDLGALHFSDPRIRAEPVLLPESEFRKHPAQDGTKFRLTVPAEVGEGLVEVRAAGRFGLSTSRAFAVLPAGTALQAKAGAAHHRRETAPELPLETVAHGRADAGQIDWWKFTAGAGQRLLVHCQAERIDSRADAVLAVVDAGGRELERSRRALGRDPLLDFTAPASGDYWVGVHDLLYGGGAGYPYLLAVSARPWIDAVWPPAVEAGQTAELTLLGRNLPGGSPGEGLALGGKPLETLAVRVTAPGQADPPAFFAGRPAGALVPVFAWRHESGANPVRIGLAETPVTVAPDGGGDVEVAVPCEVAGRFERPREHDRYRFAAKSGTTYWIETVGERLSGEIDPYLVVEKITAADDGSENFALVAEHDDDADRGGPAFDGGTRDAALAFTAEADGDYRVTVLDQYAGFGPDKIYRLLIREARPDFELLAVAEREHVEGNEVHPAAPFLRRGGTASLRVLVRRTGGFDGPVTLEASGLPEGVDCPPVLVAGKDEAARLVFRAKPDAPGWAGTVTVTGRAALDGSADVVGGEILREARGAAVVWGVPDRTRLRTRLRSRADTGIPLAVSGTEAAPAAIEAAADGPLQVVMGQSLEIPVKVLAREGVTGALNVTVEGLRGLARPPAVDLAEGAGEGKLTLAFTEQRNIFTPEPGTWSFVLKATGTASYRHHPEAAERAEEDRIHAEEQLARLAEAAAAAKEAAAAAGKSREQAGENLAAASPEAKAALEEALAEAEAAGEVAEKAAAEADARRAEAEKAKTEAEARAKAAADKAAPKDVKFTTYSPPLSVTVEVAP